MLNAEPDAEHAEAGEAELVQGARAGDMAAFGELVRRYQTSVYNVCYRLLGQRAAAEDLAQEAFIRAYERLDRFDASRPFGPWMRRVATNLCLNHLECQPKPSLAFEDEIDQAAGDDAWQDPATAAEQAETTAALRTALRALPPRFRAVIELRHFQELSYAEIADALGCPLSDVKSDLFRARKLLARLLKREA